MTWQDAAKLAREAHAGQVDKLGRPYYRHLERVAARAANDRQVAYLHDVIEDTAETADSLRDRGYSRAVVAEVEALTRRSDETYAQYIDRVAARGAHTAAYRVKVADLLDHLDDRDAIPESLARRYDRALATLGRAAR